MNKTQSGFLYKLKPKDYITGASPLVWEDILPTADWIAYLPAGEKQFSIKFDTMSCTTFSALNTIETLINFLIAEKKLSDEHLAFLKDYIEDDKVNFSDRFTAISSGTTEKGNYFQDVLDSVRKDGLLPEKDLPFNGKTWAEYHDKSKITEEMKNKAKQFSTYFLVNYEWVPVSDTSLELAKALKQSPLQVAVTKNSPRHAIMLPKIDYEFETYSPYLRKRTRDIAYAMKIKVSVLAPTSPVDESLEVDSTNTPFRPKNFKLSELVPDEILKNMGEKAWELLDERLLKNIQYIREKLNKPIYINTSSLQFRGFDPKKAYSGYRENLSQHTFGRAIDFTVKGMTAEQVRNWLKENYKELPEPNIWVENDVEWVHLDVRYSDKKGVYFFNP